MSNTLTKIEISRLPEVTVTDHRKLELAIDVCALAYAEAAANTAAAWKMFDDAVEDGDTEQKNDLAELAAFCESVQALTYQEWQDAKQLLLSLSN
jgi:hypothetical protein